MSESVRPAPAGDPAAPVAAGPAPARRGRRTIGVPGIVLMIVGAAVVLVSFTSLDWYAGSQGADAVHGIGFSDLHHNLASLVMVPAATKAYFAWLAWVLLILVIVVALVANLPVVASNGLRVLGLFLGLVGAAFTYYALAEYIQALHDQGAQPGGVLDHARAGIWLAMGGYVLAGLGASLGPLRREQRSA